MPEAARLRYTLVAGATAIVIGVGFTVAGLHRQVGDRPSPRSAGVPLVTVEPPEPAATANLLDDAVAATSSPTPIKAPPISRKPSPRATSAKPAPSRTTPTKPSPPPTTSTAVLTAVLADINAARQDAGLQPLTLDAKLSKASALHNQLMINGCGLSHQCKGESGIGDRFSAQGVQWTAAGENIGFGSSGSSEADIIKNANGLTASMLAEKPPDDGHRKNLLSTSFTRIGLSVVLAGGRVWMTQDFVN
jgi:uncharacterized protein YkwD